MPNADLRPDWRIAAGVIAALTAWRLAALGFDSTELWVDEAQYWLWGQHPDWGYFSKPPMIAFVLRAVTDLAGSDTVFWIRMPGAILHAITAMLVGLSAARLYDARIGAWAAITYVTLPYVTLGSWLFSTDTVMLPFFALALYAWLRLTDEASLKWAVICGIAMGGGFLSKYALIYLPISLTLAVLVIPAARIAWRDALIVAISAALVAAPNIWWNISNGGTTVRHIAEDNARIGTAGIDPAQALEFLASQLAVFGPILFASLAAALILLARRKAPAHSGFLLILSATVLSLMTVQAARAGANANWAVTAYIGGTILAVAVLAAKPWLLKASLALHLAIAVLFPLAFVFGDSLRLPNGQLLAQRYVGPVALSTAIAETARAEGLGTIVAERRGVLADLFHTLKDSDLTIRAIPPKGNPKNYYQQTFPLPPDQTGDVLFVTSGNAPCPAATTVTDYQATSGIYRNTPFTFFRVPANCFPSAP